MSAYSLSQLSDRALLRGLASLVAQDRATTAALLAHLAEVDARRLYLPAAYPSMHAYCVQELRFSEQAAFHRIRAARTARQFPAIFAAVADGRLHLSAVVLLSPYLMAENADQLLTVAAHKSKAEIERLIAERFPRLEVAARVRALATQPAQAQASEQLSPGIVESQPTPAIEPRPTVAPLAPQRFALQLTMGQEMHDDLRRARELLSHQIPSGDVAQVIHRALKALIGQSEKRKFAATTRPRKSRRPSPNPRHIPAQVKRAVWERDGGQCTFVSEAGRRCPARVRLEFDHVTEVARGGRATVAGIRLRCRAHNQYGAECTFGAEFMRHKRDEARRNAAEERARAATEDVITPLRLLGFRVDEARRAAALCDTIPGASLEQRVRLALSYFRPRPQTHRSCEATTPHG